MIFGRVPLAQAQGGILAHNTKTADRVLRKGALIDDAAFALLRPGRHQRGDHRPAGTRRHAGGRSRQPSGRACSLAPSCAARRMFHGRVNLIADTSGLLRLDVAKLHAFNQHRRIRDPGDAAGPRRRGTGRPRRHPENHPFRRLRRHHRRRRNVDRRRRRESLRRPVPAA